MLTQMLIMIDAYPDADREYFLVQNLMSHVFAEFLVASLKKKARQGPVCCAFPASGPGEWEPLLRRVGTGISISASIGINSSPTHPSPNHVQTLSKLSLNLIMLILMLILI